jgi:hypothetical protein
MLNLYLRTEPTTDQTTIARCAARGRFDVVAYRDANCTTMAARWPWYYSSKPKRGARHVTFNCYRWKAIWPILP